MGGSKELKDVDAFETPPDEGEVEHLLEQAGRDALRDAKRALCDNIDQEFSQLLQTAGDSSTIVAKKKSVMELWMEDYTTGCPPVEPEILEAKRPPLMLKGFGEVKDPWGEALQQEAEAKAAKWAIASSAYGRSSAGKGTKSCAKNHVAKALGGTTSQPMVYWQLPTPPRIEEEEKELGVRLAVRDETFVAERMDEDDSAGSRKEVKAESGRRRKRGRRNRGTVDGREEEEIEVWCFNSSGAPQLRAALNHASSRGGKMPAAVLSQEHHACASRLVDLQAQAKKLGWRIASAHAVRTQGKGRSAGVGVCTPMHIAAGRREGAGWDWSTPDSLGRAVALWVQNVVPCGIYLASCYMHDSEGGTQRNLALLAEVLGRLQATRCPWVVGLDAQEEPDEFVKWAGPLLNKVGGKIVATGKPTFFPGVGRAKQLDFFIVLESLVSAVKKVGTTDTFCCRSKDCQYTINATPHRMVWASFHNKAAARLKRVLRTPRRFDPAKPCGCARAPCAPQALQGDEGLRTGAWYGQEKVSAASEKWSSLVGCIEVELCGVLDLFRGTQPDPKWRGRGQGVDAVLRPGLAAEGLRHTGQAQPAGVRQCVAVESVAGAGMHCPACGKRCRAEPRMHGAEEHACQKGLLAIGPLSAKTGKDD